jgi:branched-chain amino acid transport system substrate-binding protein
LVLVLFSVISVAGCTAEQTIRIGFLGGLSGRVADLGIAGRDGVILAIEEINRQGGVNGKRIELLIRDDRQDSETARQAVEELIEEGVVAIIGPMTSAMSMAIHETINEKGILTISPTASTNELTGIDDHFLRVYPASHQTGSLLARYVVEEWRMQSVCAVLDMANRQHTESALKVFKHEFESLGGELVARHEFSSGEGIKFSELARELQQHESDCIYVLANAMDTAMLCQQMEKLEHRPRVIATDWSATDEVIQYGGRSVEGLFFIHTVDRNSTEQRYLDFRQKFHDRFGHDPSFPSIHSYDAIQVLLSSLERQADYRLHKDEILSTRVFEGLQTEIEFDQYGDVKREHFPFEIRNGQFEKVIVE